MAVTFRNLTSGNVSFQVFQRGAWRSIAIPPTGTVTTEAERVDQRGQALISAGSVAVVEGAVGGASVDQPPPLDPPRYLTKPDADRYYVTRSEFRAAAATGQATAVINKTNLSTYKGSDPESSLSAQPTTGETRLNQVVLTLIEGRVQFWQIQPWNGISTEDIDAGLVFPNDFHPTSNARLFALLFSF